MELWRHTKSSWLATLVGVLFMQDPGGERVYAVNASENGLTIEDKKLVIRTSDGVVSIRTTAFVPWSDIARTHDIGSINRSRFARIERHDGSTLELSAGHVRSRDKRRGAEERRAKIEMMWRARDEQLGSKDDP